MVATNAVLGVVCPHMCGIGGDAFVLVDPGDGSPAQCLNASGWSSALADPAGLRSAGLTELPVRGGLAVTVPGAVDGWREVLARFGRLELPRLLAPAVERARGGYAVSRRMAATLRGSEALLREDPWLAQTFLTEGRPVEEGDVLRLPELAATLEELARSGLRSFYEGPVAAETAAAVTSHGGSMIPEDLAAYHAEWVEPLVLDRGPLRVTVPPPNSQAVALLWMLDSLLRERPAGAAATLRLLVEAKKRAFRLRDTYVTDPRFMPVAPRDLLALHSSSAGAVVAHPGGGDTVYLAAWDGRGMMVSMIQSLYYGFGSGLSVPGRGVVLQNRGAYFSLDESSANILRPRKRPLHTLICTLIQEHAAGRRVALGTMGGDGQPQILAQVVAHHLAGMPWDEALAQPRWIHGEGGLGDRSDEALYETGMSGELVAALGEVTQPVEAPEGDGTFGHAHVISVGGETAVAATDPRCDGAVGVP
jgi:gamma-glutamyltranspeptidase/glutathione hydrolase